MLLTVGILWHWLCLLWNDEVACLTDTPWDLLVDVSLTVMVTAKANYLSSISISVCVEAKSSNKTSN
jgi:hypothetical protein